MIRKIFIFIVVLCVFVFGAVFIFINTFDLNKFLPQVTGQLSQTLGRPVIIKKAGLQLSLKYGVVADVQGISIAEDEKFAQEPFLSIGHIHCGVNILALLTKRQVEITSILVQSPQVTLIRNEHGEFNYQSLINSSKPAQTSGGTTQSSGSDQPQQASLPKLLVNSFEIQDARIVFMDRAMNPVMKVSLEMIDAKVTSFSLTEPFKVQMDAAFFSTNKNIHIQGSGRLDMKLQQFRCDDVRLSFDLGQLDIERLNKDIGALNAIGLQTGLNGLIDVAINQMVVGPKGLLVLSLNGQIANGRIPLKMLVKPVDQLSVKFDVNESKAKLSEFSLNIGSGRISGAANIKEYMTTQGFEFESKIENILLEDTLDLGEAPARLKGTLGGTIKLNGQGFAPDSLSKMTGQAQFLLTDGELTNVNIIKSILEHIPVLSTLNAIAGNQLSDWQTEIAGDITKIENATIKSRIDNALILLDEAKLKSQKFELVANGQSTFDQTLDMNAQVIMSKELSQSIVDSAGDMKALLDDKGEIRFPVNITGKIPNLKYMPDMEYISKLFIVNKGSDALQKVLDKNPEAKKFLEIFTGGGEDETAGQDSMTNTQEPTQEGESQEESTGKQLLKNLLNNF